jgi:hypothetical protein
VADNGISEHYASPNLRWALLREDYPGAEFDWEIVAGEVLEIPERWGGGDEFCVVTIKFPDDSGKLPVTGWKAATEVLHVERWKKGGARGEKEWVDLEPSAELLNVLVTKTLGRALKRAGYPDSMPELKAVMAWRRRLRELDGFVAAGALPPGEQSELPELDAAAVHDPEHVGAEEAPAGVDAATGEVLDVDSHDAGEDRQQHMRELVGKLNRTGQTTVRRWARDEQGWGWPVTEAEHVEAVIAKAEELAHPKGESEAKQYAPGEEPFEDAS